MITDTRPEAAAIQRELLRNASPARRLALCGQMTESVLLLALSGLRSRFPHDSEEMIRRRLADLLLGKELALKVYGPAVEGEHHGSNTASNHPQGR